jgi:DnaK suppressor protein
MKNIGLDQSFIDGQRARLETLRAELIAAAGSKVGEEKVLGAESASEAREYEDDAQKLTILELDSNLVAHDQERLALVERALRKIEDGTYGRSDLSGDVIPRERLEAIPEAIYTVAEQELREH